MTEREKHYWEHFEQPEKDNEPCPTCDRLDHEELSTLRAEVARLRGESDSYKKDRDSLFLENGRYREALENIANSRCRAERCVCKEEIAREALGEK